MTRSLFRICFNSLFFFSPTNGQDICPVVQIDPNARTVKQEEVEKKEEEKWFALLVCKMSSLFLQARNSRDICSCLSLPFGTPILYCLVDKLASFSANDWCSGSETLRKKKRKKNRSVSEVSRPTLSYRFGFGFGFFLSFLSQRCYFLPTPKQ